MPPHTKPRGGGLIRQMCFRKVNHRPAKVIKCCGLNTAARKMVECGKSNDHDLWVGRQVGGAYDGSPLFMCKVCGAYASAQCKALKRPCTRSWGGRRNGFVRFMGGRHPCLNNVLIEGQRCITAADVASGVRSCVRHNIYGAKSSEGGIKRPTSRRVGGVMAGQTEQSPPAKVTKVVTFRPGEPAGSGLPPVLP